jgi:hypothetical protein
MAYVLTVGSGGGGGGIFFFFAYRLLRTLAFIPLAAVVAVVVAAVVAGGVFSLVSSISNASARSFLQARASSPKHSANLWFRLFDMFYL